MNNEHLPIQTDFPIGDPEIVRRTKCHTAYHGNYVYVGNPPQKDEHPLIHRLPVTPTLCVHAWERSDKRIETTPYASSHAPTHLRMDSHTIPESTLQDDGRQSFCGARPEISVFDSVSRRCALRFKKGPVAAIRPQSPCFTNILNAPPKSRGASALKTTKIVGKTIIHAMSQSSPIDFSSS